MSQFLRPNSTITSTGWSAGFGVVDEAVPSDADFTWSTDNVAATIEFGLSDPAATPATGTTTVRYRLAKTKSGVVDGTGSTLTVTASLVQGTTVLASDVVRTPDGTWTQYSWTPDTSGVTDWADVRVRFVTTASGGSPANRRGAGLSWVEVEAPDGASPVTGTGSVLVGLTASGSGTVAIPPVTGTGSVSLGLTVSGSGAVTIPPVTGTGAALFGLTVSGAGTVLSPASLTIDLLQDTTVIASWQRVPGTMASEALELTGPQRDAITNWSALELRLTHSGNAGRSRVEQASLVVPVVTGNPSLALRRRTAFLQLF